MGHNMTLFSLARETSGTIQTFAPETGDYYIEMASAATDRCVNAGDIDGDLRPDGFFSDTGPMST